MQKRLEDWVTPEALDKILEWCSDGLTMAQIAANIGISRKTLYEWIAVNENLCDTIKKGKDRADEIIENALFQTAKEGNVTAQIFWLKNRRRDRWTDRIVQEHTGDINETIVLEVQ